MLRPPDEEIKTGLVLITLQGVCLFCYVNGGSADTSVEKLHIRRILWCIFTPSQPEHQNSGKKQKQQQQQTKSLSHRTAQLTKLRQMLTYTDLQKYKVFMKLLRSLSPEIQQLIILWTSLLNHRNKTQVNALG